MSDTGSPGTFKEEYMTLREHMDPDKHWIGEGLPAPSIGDITYAGALSAVGDSVFPARADHTHDIHTRFMTFNSTSKSVASGATVAMDTLSQAGGENWFTGTGSVSGKRMALPQEGLYIVQARWAFTRSTGTYVSGDRIIVADKYQNNTVTKTIYRGPTNTGETVFAIPLVDIISRSTTTDFNLEFEVTNNCAVSINAAINISYAIRMASAFGVDE